jgi:hypothetical protein
MFTDVSKLLANFIIREIALMMETSVNFYQTTRRNIPEDSHLHPHRHEKLKSDLVHLSSRFSFQYELNKNMIQKDKGI